MKKLIIVLFFLALVTPVFAQNSPDNHDIYYVNVPIEKIYVTREGFVIQYRTQTGTGIIGVPNGWFTDPAGKADIINLQSAGSWPSMSVFYHDGQFSYVRLYVQRSKGHFTWGSIPQGTDVSRFFPEEGAFNIQF